MAFLKRQGIDLATFVSGIVRALTKGQQALPKARREQIEKHFDRDEHGVFHPKTHVFQINDHQQVTIPTFSMARVNQIGIDSALIKCAARIVDIEQHEIDCELSDHTHQVTYSVQPATDNNKSFEIEIKFSRRMDTETENKLDEFLRGLVEIQDIDQSSLVTDTGKTGRQPEDG